MTKQKATPARKPGPKGTPKPKVPTQAPSPYDFKAPDVDKDLYEEPVRSYPAAIWMAKFGGDEDESRPWVIDQDRVSAMPVPFWSEQQFRFGGAQPGAENTDVYLTQIMRCVPLGVRKRQVVEVTNPTTNKVESTHYYPIFTPADQRVQGRLSFHYQVLIHLQGLPLDELVVIGLRGLTRTLSWQHDGQRYDGFPVGVEDTLQKYAADASKVVGGEMPMWCAWWVDLRGAYADNKPYYMPVGPQGDTWVQPFMADMRTSKEPRLETGVYTEDGYLAMDQNALPWTRYVGEDMFNSFQDIRRETVNPWIAEWAEASIQEATGNEYEAAGDEPLGVEEDPIPF